MASPALPGLFFCFVATVLLIIVRVRFLLTRNTSHLLTQVSISAPTWNSVYFLRASDGGLSYHFGVLGYTGSKAQLGYRFPITYVFYRCRSWKLLG
jgi:hypothetical protein